MTPSVALAHTQTMKRKLVIVVAVLMVGLGVNLYDRLTLSRRGEQSFTRLGCGGCHFSGGGPNLTLTSITKTTMLYSRSSSRTRTTYTANAMVNHLTRDTC